MVYSVAVVLDTKDADALRMKLMPVVLRDYPGFPKGDYTEPFYPLLGTETVSVDVETKSRESAAKILETAPENLCLQQTYVAMYTDVVNPVTKQPSKNTGGKALTILALGDLSTNNGLPQIEDAVLSLKSGELLAAPLDRSQHFKGRGGGLGRVCIWGLRV